MKDSSERGISCTAERLPASRNGLCSTTLLSLNELQARLLKQQNLIRTTAIGKHTLSIHCIWSAPIPAAARTKVWVCGYSLAGIAGSNPAGGIDVLSLVSVVTQMSLRRSAHSSRRVLPSVVYVECDREASKWGGPGQLGAVAQWKYHQKFDFKQCRQEASPMHIIRMAVVYFGTPNTTTAVMHERAVSHRSTNVYSLCWRMCVCVCVCVPHLVFLTIHFLSTINF